MAVLDEVVLALRAVGIAAHTTELAQPRKPLAGPGQEFVDVRLMAGVPQDPVPRALEYPMERQGQLDHSEVGTKMAARLGDGCDQELPNLLGESAQIGIAQGAKIGRAGDPVEDGCAGNLVHIRFESSERPVGSLEYPTLIEGVWFCSLTGFFGDDTMPLA